MRKLNKIGVALAGVVGVIGFFLPLVSVGHQGVTASFSTASLVSGVGDIRKHLDGVGELTEAQAAEAQAGVAAFNEGLKQARPVFIAIFIPSALLLLLGILGIAVGRFGRGLGALALVCGLAAIGIYLLLRSVVGEAASQEAAQGAIGSGAHLVALSGVLGLVFGISALISPERGFKRKGKRFKATIASKPPQI